MIGPTISLHWWTDARIEQLKRLWNEKLSAQQIADEMNAASRSAILGKAHRLGLEAHGQPTGVKRRRRRRRRKLYAPQKIVEKLSVPAPPKVRAPQKKSADKTPADKARATSLRLIEDRQTIDKAIAANGGIPFFEIEPEKCRWPMTEVSPLAQFRFCGATATNGSYCWEHYRRSRSRYFIAEAAE